MGGGLGLCCTRGRPPTPLPSTTKEAEMRPVQLGVRPPTPAPPEAPAELGGGRAGRGVPGAGGRGQSRSVWGLAGVMGTAFPRDRDGGCFSSC